MFNYYRYYFCIFLGNSCNDQVLSVLVCKQLEKIDLAVNHDVTFSGLMKLSALAKDSLSFLGLGYCAGIMIRREQFVQNLHTLFPSLQQLDLS